MTHLKLFFNLWKLTSSYVKAYVFQEFKILARVINLNILWNWNFLLVGSWLGSYWVGYLSFRLNCLKQIVFWQRVIWSLLRLDEKLSLRWWLAYLWLAYCQRLIRFVLTSLRILRRSVLLWRVFFLEHHFLLYLLLQLGCSFLKQRRSLQRSLSDLV